MRHAVDFCPYPTSQRMKGLMPMPLFRKIIDEAATIPQISQLCITGLGEPLLDPKLVERVRYARECLPGRFMDLYTNGSYLTPARFDALRDAGLSCISVSLNAVRADQRRDVMGLDDFERVCGYIEYGIQHRGMVLLQVKAVVNGDSFNADDSAEFYKRWGALRAGGYGQTVWEGNWAGVNREAGPPRTLNENCHRALGQIYVTWDGRVTPCCFMPDADQVCLGDLKTQTIREIYNASGYVTFREAHDDRRGKDYDYCARCTAI